MHKGDQLNEGGREGRGGMSVAVGQYQSAEIRWAPVGQ